MSGLSPSHVKGEKEIHFMYGPATGGLMESAGVGLITPGELIRKATVYRDYKKRKIKLRNLSVEDALLRVERINGFHSASHSIAFLSAVEDALGVNISESVRARRIAMLELERMRSNLEVIKRMLEAAALGVPVNQIGYLREKVSRVISHVAGHRFFFAVNGVNSAAVNLPAIGDDISQIRKEFLHIFEGLQESKIFLNRMQTTGIVKGFPMVGPAARASGMRYDARLDSRTLSYEGTGYKPVVHDECDTFARFMVRADEVIQAAGIISSVGKSGRGNETGPQPVDGSGSGAARIESPAGDLFYSVSLNDGVIDDIWFTTPSELNILAFEQSYPGNLVTDFHLDWEGFGIWIAEAGVDII